MFDSFWKGSPTDKVDMEKFDKSRIVMKPISHSVAKKVILKHHYSHTFPAAELYLGFYVDEKLNGLNIYNDP